MKKSRNRATQRPRSGSASPWKSVAERLRALLRPAVRETNELQLCHELDEEFPSRNSHNEYFSNKVLL